MKAKTDEEIKAMPIAEARKCYSELAKEYDRVTNPDVKKYLFCHHCNKFISSANFYTDEDNASGYFYICKNCVQMMVEQRRSSRDEPKETKESVQFVLRLMNRPYIDELYDSCVKSAIDATKEKVRFSPFASYIPMIKTLQQYKDKRWDDSVFGEDHMKNGNVVVTEEAKENVRKLNKARKRFGKFPDEDLLFLEEQYEDWVSRYECNTKSTEEIFKRICFNQLENYKARLRGDSVKENDKSFQDLLTTQNISPRQNSSDPLSDAQTFGTLIKKYEETRPLPDIDPALKDQDKIGLYIDTFYRGHMAKMLGLKNGFTNIYDKVMSKYTVKPPEYENEDDDSEAIFSQIFNNYEDY